MTASRIPKQWLPCAARQLIGCGPAGDDRAAIVAAIEKFLDFGDAGEYSPAELWDYFAISAPTIPALAGCDALAEDRLIRIFSTCTHARYGGGQPLGEDWPWYE